MAHSQGAEPGEGGVEETVTELAVLAGGMLLAAVIVRLVLEPVAVWLTARGVVALSEAGATLPVGAGLALVPAVTSALLLIALGLNMSAPEAAAAALGVNGFALLGFVDDVLSPAGGSRGLRGHTAALLGGRLTTGVWKLGTGLLVAATAAATLGSRGAVLVADVILIAGAADLCNLMDTRPGRCITTCLTLATLGLVVTASHARIAWPVLLSVAAAVYALKPADAGGRLMLGDTGAYAAGGVIGIAVVGGAAPVIRVVGAVALMIVEAAALFVSFRAVTDGLMGRGQRGSDRPRS